MAIDRERSTCRPSADPCTEASGSAERKGGRLVLTAGPALLLCPRPSGESQGRSGTLREPIPPVSICEFLERLMLPSIKELFFRARRVLRRSEGVDYEGTWDQRALAFKRRNPGLSHIGDQWAGVFAGVSGGVTEYAALIEERFIAPRLQPSDVVLEIGVGGGRTAELLLRHAGRLIAADVSRQMLRATRQRFAESAASEGRLELVKLDGSTLDGIPDRAADVCFCFDTLVHMDPRDIFNYLTRIPAKLGGRRICILHHNDVLSDFGWQRFLFDWDRNLMGRRRGTPFSVISLEIMRRFLEHLGYTIDSVDTTTIPRDCVWVCTAPESIQPELLRPSHEAYQQRA